MVEAVEAGQGHELELVAHRSKLALEPGDRLPVELRLPVEACRAIVRHHLAGLRLLHCLGEAPGVLTVGMARCPPEEVGVGREGAAPTEVMVEARPFM